VRQSVSVATQPLQRVRSRGGSASSSLGEAASRTFFDPIQRGIRSATGSLDDVTRVAGGDDSRLLMQLGVLLGTVYAAFLTIWFWATRLRPERYR
jgi:hypothetical protein